MSEREIVDRLAWIDRKLTNQHDELERRIKRIESMVQQIGQMLERRR